MRQEEIDPGSALSPEEEEYFFILIALFTVYLNFQRISDRVMDDVPEFGYRLEETQSILEFLIVNFCNTYQLDDDKLEKLDRIARERFGIKVFGEDGQLFFDEVEDRIPKIQSVNVFYGNKTRH